MMCRVRIIQGTSFSLLNDGLKVSVQYLDIPLSGKNLQYQLCQNSSYMGAYPQTPLEGQHSYVYHDIG